MQSDPSSSSPRTARNPFARRTIRIIGFAALCLITLLFLAVAIENWRGRRAWERYRSELEAQGEQLDLEAFAPKLVPAEANFCATPFLAALGERQTNAKAPATRIQLELGSGEAGQPPVGGNLDKGTFEDFKGWRAFYSGNTNYPQAPARFGDAEAVLVALGKYDAIITELRQARHRPHAVLSVDYSDPVRLVYEDQMQPLMPLLAGFKGVSRLLSLHAAALLETERPAEALQDVEVGLRVAEALGEDPLLISQLVRFAVVRIMMQPVWEGLAKRRWEEPQLAELQHRLGSIDFLISFQESMRGERAFFDAMCELYRGSGRDQPQEDRADSSEDPAMRFMDIAPKGWLYQNQVACNRLFQEWVFPVISPAEHRIHLDRQRELERWPQERGGGVYTVQARMLAPAVSKAAFKFARSQAFVDLASVGCALERYRLAEGEYPATLNALTPGFLENLPPDVINGAPLKYRLTESGRFVLYSVGLNEKDDGGSIGLRDNGRVDDEQGDWVWRYPDE